ncbi:hypothetical protein Pla22_29950 [Rubripirellula amarantea]|uniref:Uncharacterized protein n=1 Tax=Rubripirellula amarantea TaxID=2527999 RepID=A0A5C5WHH2_9BACT|nr:hypothetical protein Pla22_29950 [Rubripirellula amarantea]
MPSILCDVRLNGKCMAPNVPFGFGLCRAVTKRLGQSFYIGTVEQLSQLFGMGSVGDLAKRLGQSFYSGMVRQLSQLFGMGCIWWFPNDQWPDVQSRCQYRNSFSRSLAFFGFSEM